MQRLERRNTTSIKLWEDPCGDAGHADIDEMKKFETCYHDTQAYMFAKNKKHVWTFSSYDEKAVFSDRNMFSYRSCIKKWKRLLSDLFCRVTSIICE